MYFVSRHKALQASHYCSNIKEVSLFGDFVISIIQSSQDNSELVFQQFVLSSNQKPELKPFQTISLSYSVKSLEILLCHSNKCFAIILTESDSWKEATIYRANKLISNGDDFEDRDYVEDKSCELFSAQSQAFTFSVQREIQSQHGVPVLCRWSRNGAEYVILFQDGGVLLRSYFKQYDIAYFHPYCHLPDLHLSEGVDLSPDGLILATLNPGDNRATFWTVTEPELGCMGELDSSLITNISAGSPYLGKFSRVEGLAHRYRFIAVHSVITKKDSSQSCLVVWEPPGNVERKSSSKGFVAYYPIRTQKLPRVLKGRYTYLAISQGGRYIAIGNADGGVVVYDAYYLHKVHTTKGSVTSRGHQSAITNLYFLSQKSTEEHDYNFELFSFSKEDQYLMWHAAAPRKKFFVSLIFILVISGILLFIYFFSMLGL